MINGESIEDIGSGAGSEGAALQQGLGAAMSEEEMGVLSALSPEEQAQTAMMLG